MAAHAFSAERVARAALFVVSWTFNQQEHLHSVDDEPRVARFTTIVTVHTIAYAAFIVFDLQRAYDLRVSLLLRPTCNFPLSPTVDSQDRQG